MKPALFAICVLSACQPALAGTAQVKESICTQSANLAYIGVEDGIEMYSIIDGADEAITAANVGGNIWAERMAVSSYLSGYSVGLLQTKEPADFAEYYFAVCMAESN
ncbi:hypothetical protein [Paracoccus onubensis]|uniref:Lipoprotein n=1 Tax=Paracoccus onubensis TaxID=1675788 RepID=A0A418SPV9_9RHOB|nr:hypothetical protein [Paracoccus onubensis]RJE82975.1 hypothetical protein D3P04_18280 [Paracoccus onubensis]